MIYIVKRRPQICGIHYWGKMLVFFCVRFNFLNLHLCLAGFYDISIIFKTSLQFKSLRFNYSAQKPQKSVADHINFVSIFFLSVLFSFSLFTIKLTTVHLDWFLMVENDLWVLEIEFLGKEILLKTQFSKWLHWI